jgi:hypothetical protein
MWFNGFIVVIDKALEALGDPVVQRHRDAILMGAFREDVCLLSRSGLVLPSASMTHFQRPGWPGGFIPFVWPDAAQRARKFFDRALREHHEGRQTSAFVQLGRATHPLIDMACPVHAQGVAHKSDPFEWNVEAMAKELRRLPADAFAGNDVEGVVRGLAQFGQRFKADKTTSPWGRVMRRMGLRKPVGKAEAREQARVLIPRAAGATAALIRLFLDEAKALREEDPSPIPHLEMSLAGLRIWLAQLEQFCARHGGAQLYGDMLELIARCRAAS